MSKVEEIIEQLKSLTLLEAADLVKQIEETFDVSAAAPVGGVGMMMAPGAAAACEHVAHCVRSVRIVGGLLLKCRALGRLKLDSVSAHDLLVAVLVRQHDIDGVAHARQTVDEVIATHDQLGVVSVAGTWLREHFERARTDRVSGSANVLSVNAG